jgi:hypothetical protein
MDSFCRSSRYSIIVVVVVHGFLCSTGKTSGPGVALYFTYSRLPPFLSELIYLQLFCFAVSYLVEALCYKPEGRGFDYRLSEWMFFNSHSASRHTMALGFTQYLKEMSTRNLPWG